MLTELHVENLGVIADTTLVFGPGMTALTGETGAGKTLLVEAISLLGGGRADASLVRPGADEARVEGRFVVGDDEIVLCRVIPADGRSRAYVNGRLATVATLQEDGERLIDLHGQNSHQSLLGVAAQRAALDRFAGVDLEPLMSARHRRATIERELAGMGGDARARAREADLVRFQVTELDEANLVDIDEDTRLDREEDLLGGAATHREHASAAIGLLAEEDGALDQLRRAIASLSGRSPFVEPARRLVSNAAELDDVVTELRQVLDSIDDSPERLAEIRLRRQLLRDLRKKYGDTLAEIVAERDVLRARLVQLEQHDTEIARLEAERDACDTEIAAAAAIVATARHAGSAKLGAAVQKQLRPLALGKARVTVEVTGDDPADDVQFLLSANPGEPLQPLSKVASGGELARTMLALRLVLTEAPDTLVFDEVDAGVGGEAALAVGQSLAALGRRHQVLVVTHLAQVAAAADTQIVVSKAQEGKRTVSRAVTVSEGDRERELSRMLSGLAESESGRQHAAELLASARRTPGS
jgi:DNA repair protein RecN (Recombination protein N)